MTMLQLALSYAALGWAVFPLRPNQKTPLLSKESGGHGCLDATLDPAKIAYWWTKWPDANIGIATGPISNLLVIDLDRHNGLNGIEEWREHGRTFDTLAVTTPSGGMHLYYQYPKGESFTISARQLGVAIDMRAQGGYVVAPGSTLAEGAYDWDGPEDAPILPCPAWLILDLRSTRRRDISRDDETPRFREGSRNADLTSLAGTMRKRGVSPAGILALLREENSRCVPPLDDAEVVGIAESLARYDETAPRTVETDVTAMIKALSKDSPAPAIAEVLTIIATRPSAVEREHLTLAVSRATGQSTKALNQDLRPYLKEQSRATREETRAQKHAAAEAAYLAVADLILVPIAEPDSPPDYMAAHVIISKAGGGDYLWPFWSQPREGGANRSANTSILRLIADRLSAANPDFMDAHQEDGWGPVVGQVRRRLEVDLQMGRIGKPTLFKFGPYLDPTEGVMYTATDLDKGIAICRGEGSLGAEFVREAQAPALNPEAFAKFQEYLGETWADALAHILSSIVNEDPERKHALAILGSSGAGKSTLAKFLATLVEGNYTLISPSQLEGAWPRFFGSRTPIIDNIDNASLKMENWDVLALALSSKRATIPARYTPSGLTAEAGYPILTSIYPDLLERYRPMQRRCIIIQQNYSEAGRAIAQGWEGLTVSLRPHVWALVESFLVAVRDGKIPAMPGNLDCRGWARVRWWVATELEGMSAADAEKLIGMYRPSDTQAAEDSPFVKAWDKAFAALDQRGELPKQAKASTIYAILQKYAQQETLNIRYGKRGLMEYAQPAQAIRSLITRHRLGNRIGEWEVMDRRDSKNGVWLYEIRRGASGGLAGGENQPPAEINPRDTRSPGGAGGAGGENPRTFPSVNNTPGANENLFSGVRGNDPPHPPHPPQTVGESDVSGRGVKTHPPHDPPQPPGRESPDQVYRRMKMEGRLPPMKGDRHD